MKYNAIIMWIRCDQEECSIILLNHLPEKWTDGLKKTEESEVKVNASLDKEGRNQKEESALKFVSMCTPYVYHFSVKTPVWKWSSMCVHGKRGGISMTMQNPERIRGHHCEWCPLMCSSWILLKGSWQWCGHQEETLQPGISRASSSGSGTHTCSVSKPALLNMNH